MEMRKALFRLGEKGALVFLRPFEAGGSHAKPIYIGWHRIQPLFSLFLGAP